MGHASKCYGLWHLSFALVSTVCFLFFLIALLAFGDKCKLTCPVMTANPELITADKRRLPYEDASYAIKLDPTSGQVPWDMCNGDEMGYCMLGDEQKCQTSASILNKDPVLAFKQKCYFCNYDKDTGGLKVFGATPQAGAGKNWQPLPACGQTVLIAGVDTTPKEWSWYDYELPEGGIGPKHYTDYTLKKYPGGGSDFTLCWNLPADWQVREIVYPIDMTLALFYGLLMLTGYMSAIACFAFQDTFESDWSKLALGAKICGAIVRIMIPIQRFFHLFLSIPLLLAFIFFIPLQACSSVTTSYGKVVFHPMISAGICAFIFVYLVFCCGGCCFRKVVKMETSFYSPPVAEVTREQKTFGAKFCGVFKLFTRCVWAFGP